MMASSFLSFGGYQHVNTSAARMPTAVELKPRWMAKARALPVSRSLSPEHAWFQTCIHWGWSQDGDHA